MHEHKRLFIGGEWVEPASSRTIDVISPHSEEPVGRVPEGTEADIDPKVRAGIIRALSHVWFSALLGWVNGWTNVGAVGEELESAARLLLRDL